MKRLLLLLLLALNAMASFAGERILHYHSDITVLLDGAMAVTETIQVRAEGQAIRRGIYRDFPTDYRDASGNHYRVAFDVLGVQRDGREEFYHTERMKNGVRVYIGQADHHLEPGDYTYTIHYRTDRQLGFFTDHDELYWNVTGNGWEFSIDHASARVHLPAGIERGEITCEAYTGASGVKGENYRAETLDAGAYFETDQSLDIREGLTIVVSWPKGIVREPTFQQRLVWMLDDNPDLTAALIGLLLLTGFYLLVWLFVGRDPKSGVVIPQYDPPAGISPGAARYISRMGSDDKTFTSALVSLAVKGYLTLEQDGNEYTARRTDKPAGDDLGPGERELLKYLFAKLKLKTVPFKRKYHQRIRSAIAANKVALKDNYNKVYFITNRVWLIPGILITLVTLVASVVFSPNGEAFLAGFMMIWLSAWSVGVYILGRKVYGAWLSADSTLGYGSAVTHTLFAFPFFIAELVGLGVLFSTISFSLLAVLLIIIAVNTLFYQLLKAPTRAGRAVLDKLEGLRLYLEVAEKDELQLKYPPEKTPELFERLFPYALALDVEGRWAERFTSVFANLESERKPYNPRWYHGGYLNSQTMGGFASNLGSSLGSAISSSSAPPGSSSGSSSYSSAGSSSGSSSSGGSSGGGGGGGGGGGW
jgi:uncharacterized membrane protein YgcG